MTTKIDKQIRADPRFEELINRLARERIIRGKDKKLKGSRRITLAMTRHPLMRKIALDISEADLDE